MSIISPESNKLSQIIMSHFQPLQTHSIWGLYVFSFLSERIKRKASIELEPSKARNMMGIVDESGILEYGQVFIQYSSDVWKHENNLIILTGKVYI